MDLNAVFFWTFVTVVGLSVVWAGYLSGREAENTIRTAIERGVLLDVATIRELRFGSVRRIPAKLVIGGIILSSVALALALFGLVIAPEEPDTLLPLLGIALFIGIPALTTALVGLWLLRRRSQDGSAD